MERSYGTHRVYGQLATAKAANNFSAVTDPDVNTDRSTGYRVESKWYNTITGNLFICLDDTPGAAIWVDIALTADDLATVAFTGESGDMVETTKLFYTDARARAAISATGSISYNPATGVISYSGQPIVDYVEATFNGGRILQSSNSTISLGTSAFAPANGTTGAAAYFNIRAGSKKILNATQLTYNTRSFEIANDGSISIRFANGASSFHSDVYHGQALSSYSLNGSEASAADYINYRVTIEDAHDTGAVAPIRRTVRRVSGAMATRPLEALYNDTTMVYRVNTDSFEFFVNPKGKIESSSYTPVLTNTTNISTSTAQLLSVVRVGDEVKVSGRVTSVAATVGGSACVLEFSLPIASNFSTVGDCAGTCVGATLYEAGYFSADTANKTAKMTFKPSTTASQSFYFTFSYIIKP